MGYTHYWRQSGDFKDSEWLDVMEAAKTLLNNSPIPLEDVQINLDYIAFNGVGADGHEHCWVTRKRPDGPTVGFGFCKTARKPYDAVVVDFLRLVRELTPSTKFSLSSDGGSEIFG